MNHQIQNTNVDGFIWVAFIGLLIIILSQWWKYRSVIKRETNALPPLDEKLSLCPAILLSPEEDRFYTLLNEALPKCRVFPKISLSSVVRINATDGRQYPDFSTERAKTVLDFLVCGSDTRPLIAILVEDESGFRQDNGRAIRKRVESAGIKVLVWSATSLPDVSGIERAVRLAAD